MLGDATELGLEKQVRFVSMLDFLEHLPDLDTVRAAIASAAEAASDFLFIRHPSFEGKEVLADKGLIQYWWRWSGHTAHSRIADYCVIFDLLGALPCAIQYKDQDRLEAPLDPR